MIISALMANTEEKPAYIGVRSNPHVRLVNVVKEYETDAGSFTALNNINLEVQTGEFLGIIGKSGAGKSTLLNMISAVDRLTSGEVWIGGVQVHTLSQTQQSKWRGRSVGVIYQTFQLMSMLTLLDNIMLPVDFLGHYDPRYSVARAISLLGDLGIAEHAYKLPTQISGGQQQRVAIARALVNDPPLILADEPTGSLDTATASSTMEILKKLNQRGKTIIMATHDTSLLHYFSRIVFLFDGEMVNETLARFFPTTDHHNLITAGRNSSQQTFKPGHVIISEGETLPGLYMIIRGNAETIMNGMKIKLSPGDIFGQDEIIENGMCRSSLITSGLEDTEIALLTRNDFLNLYKEDIGFRKEIDMQKLRKIC